MFASVFAPLALLASLAAAEVIVNVGVNNTLLFDPPQVFTEVGETITFVFHSNHTATQSTFADPCTQLDGGFNTGFLSNNETASVRVNSTDPIWMYCAVGMHCEYGMVFAVNPTPSQPYDFFHAKAGLLLNATTAATNATTNATSSTVVPATSPTANTFTFASATVATAATSAATDSAASAATSAVSAATSAALDSVSAATSAAPATSAAATTSAAASSAAATDSAATSSPAATDSAATSAAAATTSAAASLAASPRVGLAGASDAVTSFATASASATDAAFAAVTTVAGETPVVVVVEKETELQRRSWKREEAFAL